MKNLIKLFLTKREQLNSMGKNRFRYYEVITKKYRYVLDGDIYNYITVLISNNQLFK